MNKNQFYNLLKPLVSIYDDIEKDMILDMLERIDNYDGQKGTLKWYLDKLNELKVFEKYGVSIVNKKNKEIKQILEEILETSVKNSVSIDTLESYNSHNNSNVSVNDIFNSTSANNLISEALKDTENISKLINTKAIESAKKEYQNILNTAYLETSTGIYTYDKSIKLAIDKMAHNGILMANYDSGRRISIESAVRRDIVTRVNKLVGDIELTTAKDLLKTNLVYVDQHLGARTRTKYTKENYEAHDEWQGKVYMINGSNEKYDNLYEKTGYGEMLGLKGINCYHDLRPYFEWESIPKPIDIEESRKEREILDTQREFERNIRTLKREKIIDKKMGYEEEYRKASKKLNKVNKEYNEWLDNNDKIRNKNREYVSQETHIKTQALSANDITFENHLKPKLLEKIDYNDLKMVNNCMEKYEKVIISDKIENAIVITSNGNVYQCFGNENSVWPNVDLGNELINAYVTHNHPIKETGFSFSSADVDLFESYNLKKLRGIDEKYLYELDRSKKCDLELPKFDEELEDTTFEHLKLIEFSINKNIFYRRVKNEGIMEQNK